MKKLFKLLLLIGVTLTSCSSNSENKLKFKSIAVDNPFKMPEIKIPDFSETDQFNIIDYGAEINNIEKTSKAIETAIDKASVKGGTVIIPKGEWDTKKIHLKSNVNLHLNKEAVLLFSDNPEDYLPAVHTSWEGLECYNYSPLIYAYECENIAITGPGKLKAKLNTWRQWYKRPTSHLNASKWLYNAAYKNLAVEKRNMVNDTANLRPHFIQFNRCKNILMDSISIENSPFWTIHPYLSKNIVIRNINVFAHGHNNDGVDPEMSENILIENSVFDQGDDAIAVKSGRNQDAWRLNQPTKNLVIRNCYVKNGHQLLAIGSELSGGVENVLIENCEVADNAKMFHLLYIKTNERRGGYVNNIIMKNIKADIVSKGVLGIETDVMYQWRDLVPTYEIALTPISNIFLKNIILNKADYFARIVGEEDLPINKVILENVILNQEDVRDDVIENVIGYKRLD